MQKKIIFGLLISVAALAGLGILPAIKKARAAEFQKGIHYVTWSKNGYNSEKSDESIKKIKDMGANWIAVLTTWYQGTCFSTDIYPTEQTPSDKSVIRAIEQAHMNNLKVMLKMHVDVQDTAYGDWRGEITCQREPDWEKWFTSYRKFLEHYLDIANKYNVEMVCIGTELTEMTLAKPEMWRSLIRGARKIYKGQLTYAANWNEEYLGITFWDELDYAGIDAYFPLSDKETPTYEELIEGWKKWYAEIEAWQKRINKPVIFPEVGYHSTKYAAKQPWDNGFPGELDTDVQVNCYKALLDTFWSKEWFYGTYWWDWGTSKQMGGPYNRNFTPQNKPAENIIREWYAKER